MKTNSADLLILYMIIDPGIDNLGILFTRPSPLKEYLKDTLTKKQ